MKTSNSCGITRRGLIAAGAALPLVTILGYPASAAEFEFKLANGQPATHPVNIRAREALDRIREATSGRLDIKLFPSGQLGSDADLMSQVRSGGIEFAVAADVILASLVPLCSISSIGFAFKDYDAVWRAMDGDLGDHIRAGIAETSVTTVSKIWDNGFRHITSSTREIKTPDDLKGFKLRVPAAPILTSLFAALGAAPTAINVTETYMALQTKIVEGQENPLPTIATNKFNEVQETCSLTGHTWGGVWIIGNKRALQRLPEDIREIVAQEFDRSAADQRADVAALNVTARGEMEGKGLRFIDVDKELFRQSLANSTFYKDWKEKFGPEAWALLEKYSGALG